MKKKQTDNYSSPIRYLIEFFKPFKFLVILFFITTVLCSFLESFGIAMLFPLFELILGQENSSQMSKMLLYPLKIIGSEDSVVSISLFFLSIIIIKILFGFLTIYLTNKTCFDVRKSIMIKISDYYLSTSYETIIRQKQGVLINNLIYEPHKVTAGLVKSTEFLTCLFMIIFYYSLLLLTNVNITFLITIISVFLYLSISLITKKYSLKYGKQEIGLNQEINAIGAESISALRQIKTFGIQSKVAGGFKRNVEKLSIVELKKLLFLASPRMVTEFIFFAGIVITIITIYLTSFDLLKTVIPTITVFTVVAQRLLGQLSRLVTLKISIDSLTPSFSLVHSLIKESESVDLEQKRYSDFVSLETDIVFDNVSFAYDGNEPLFSNLSFSIPKGKTTAIVGETGSGKSTIADILLGLYLPNNGEILINGSSIHNVNIVDWRKKIGFVSQDNYLFHTSIMENIKIGYIAASDEMVINSAKQANAHDFIVELPEGYETVVGDRGMLVSGGQKQRIAIARALIRNPEILIFDEATSALDYKTEKTLQDEIFKISKGKTVIIISHRLETVKSADTILKIENGEILKIKYHDII